MKTPLIGLSGMDFRKKVRAGCGRAPNNPTVRVMEALGVVQPIKNSCGWRTFTAQDVMRAVRWMKANPPRPKGRPPLSAPGVAAQS